MDKGDKRQAIVEAARNRFRRYGIRKTSMQEIAQDLGIAVGTLYLYFKNKDELILGCAERFAEAHRAYSNELMRSDIAPDEKLRRYIIQRFRAVEETRVGSSYSADIARAVIRLKPERFEEDERWLYGNVLTILNEGVQKGIFTITNPARDAEVFCQAISNFLPVAGMEPYRAPTETNLAKMIEWFIDKWKEPDRAKRRVREDEQRRVR